MRSPDTVGELITATVNSKVDVLEEEHRNGDLTTEAYLMGRQLQRTWERLDRIGPGGQWVGKDRVDATADHEHAIAWRIAEVAELTELTRLITLCIGTVNFRFLEAVLRHRVSFPGYAAYIGRAGPRGTKFCRENFRWCLEHLARERKLAHR